MASQCVAGISVYQPMLEFLSVTQGLDSRFQQDTGFTTEPGAARAGSNAADTDRKLRSAVTVSMTVSLPENSIGSFALMNSPIRGLSQLLA